MRLQKWANRYMIDKAEKPHEMRETKHKES